MIYEYSLFFRAAAQVTAQINCSCDSLCIFPIFAYVPYSKLDYPDFLESLNQDAVLSRDSWDVRVPKCAGVEGSAQSLLAVVLVYKTSKGSSPGGILIRCRTQISWLFLIQRNSGSNDHLMTKAKPGHPDRVFFVFSLYLGSCSFGYDL